MFERVSCCVCLLADVFLCLFSCFFDGRGVRCVFVDLFEFFFVIFSTSAFSRAVSAGGEGGGKGPTLNVFLSNL